MTTPVPLLVYAPAEPKGKFTPASIAQTIKDAAPGKQLIVACKSEAQACYMLDPFTAIGLQARAVLSGGSEIWRAEISHRIAKGRIDVICTNIRDFSEFPTVDGLVLLRRIPQSTVWLRTVMVAKRPRKGKAEAFLFDFAGNVLYHGVPE